MRERVLGVCASELTCARAGLQYLHNESYDGWKSGGYPTYSIMAQRFLARTITCSHYLKNWLLEHGHLDTDRIGVVKLGIEAAHFVPATPSRRNALKESLLGLDPGTLVITFVGRLEEQKRPGLVPRIADELLKRLPEADFVIVMLGDGSEERSLRRIISAFELDEVVRVEGQQEDPGPYYAASDIFLLPSVSEGISIATAEAMAMALPIVTARAGALPEQLGERPGEPHLAPDELGGILVNHTLDKKTDPLLYADALERLILDPKLRSRLGQNARKLVEDGFDWRTTLSGLFVETARAENLPGHGATLPGYPHPAAELAIQTLLLESWAETDQAGSCECSGSLLRRLPSPGLTSLNPTDPRS